MSISKYIFVTLGAIGAVLFALFSSPQQTPGSSLSPKFDGRDSGSAGDYFRNSQNLWIYHQSWVPEKTAEGAVVLLHGFGEHVGRYEALAQDLVNAGWAVYALDHQGFGRSEGDRAYVEKFDDYVKDAIRFTTEIVVPKHSGKPLLVFGHSMGGLMAIRVVLDKPSLFKGLILSAAAVKIDEKVAKPHLVKIGSFLSKYLPKLPLPGQNIPPEEVCHDKSVVEDYKNDPLVYHGVFKARFAFEFLHAIFELQGRLSQLKLPIYSIHSKADPLTSVEGAYMVEKAASGKDLTFKYYDAPYLHELIHEQNVRDGIVAWVKKHNK